MRIWNLLGKAGPVIGLAAATGLAGCDRMNVEFESDGVPLAELDMSGGAPTDVVLAAPDTVLISSGEAFTIDVEGSRQAAERMRFALEDGTLVIHREDGDWGSNDGQATVNIAMPPPGSLIMAGSGTMRTDAMANSAEIVIAGSGALAADGIDADDMEVTVAGSGSVEASGRTDRLELTVAGSGSAQMAALQVDNAEVSIAGSGDAEFASDGRVDASIVGSGNVRVRGSADCESDSVGSGELICGTN